MKYALNLAPDGRVLSAAPANYAPEEAVKVDHLPEGDLHDYRYDGGFLYDPIPAETVLVASKLDMIEAQLTYTAMMTDTLLEV